ncbi:TadE/TadG family type IV pilus assembly protein [Alkaliphilus crotonatoxidans]
MLKKLENLSQKKNFNRRGSMTIELAIIFPVMIYALITVFYILLILYEYAAVQSLADRTAMNGGLTWSRLGQSAESKSLLESGEVTLRQLKTPLYWRLGIFSNNKTKKDIIKEYLQEELKEHRLLTPKEAVIDVDYKNYLFYQKLIIDIHIKYQPPFPFINQIMGSKGHQLTVRSEARVKDAPEIIRNIDFAGDLLEEFEVTSNLKEKYFDSIREVRDKVQNFFK